MITSRAVPAWEKRIALAMLPIGGVMTLVSLVAFLLVLLLAVDTMLRPPAMTASLLIWCLAALAAARRNAIKSIETMSSFEWRPMAEVALVSALIALAYPGWWLHA